MILDHDLRGILEAYKTDHPGVITAEMEAWWGQWIEWVKQAHSSAGTSEMFAVPPPNEERQRFSARYLRGEGLELGALHKPLQVPPEAKVRYVDLHTLEELQFMHFELAKFDLVKPDVIDDGESLGTIPDASQDFIIASHFLEHCQDPLRTIAHHLRVLKSGGVLFYVIPDKRHSFDSSRAITTFEHLLRDYEEGPDWSREAHYQDWSEHVNKRSGVEHEAWWRLLDAIRFRIHFHVWSSAEILDLFHGARHILNLEFELMEYSGREGECFAILKKP